MKHHLSNVSAFIIIITFLSACQSKPDINPKLSYVIAPQNGKTFDLVSKEGLESYVMHNIVENNVKICESQTCSGSSGVSTSSITFLDDEQ